MSVFDFEGEILRQQREEPSITFWPNTYRMKSYLHFGAKMWLFSIPQDYILQQHGLCLLPVQLAVFDGDFASGNQWLQQHNQTWAAYFFENNKKLSVMLGFPLHLNPHGGWSCTGMIRNAYGSSRSELAIICKDCKELPSFTWRKRFFFWGRTERTHPYNKIKHRKKRYLSMN